MSIATLSDIATLEARGLETAYPIRTTYGLIKAAAEATPTATAIRYLHDVQDPARDETVSYAELLDRIHSAACLFARLGVTRARSVGLLVGPTASAHVALWGAELAGRAAPINPMLKPAHIAAILRAADAACVVMMGPNSEQDWWSDLVPALRAEGVTLPILHCDTEGAVTGADGEFEALVATTDPTPPADLPTPDTIAALYHTGGTTGAPKLVQHTHANEAHVARSCALLHALDRDDVVLNGFPLFHVAGAFVYGLSTLSAGGTLALPGRLGMRNRALMDNYWRHVARLEITVLAVVPTILSGLLGHAVDADISKVRNALTGGSPLSPELVRAFEAKTGIPVRNIFGMTETSGCIALEPVAGPQTPLACGLPVPFSEVRIVAMDATPDPESALPAGEQGIILVRGPNVSPGYTDPARNEGTFLDGGWLVTGDLGHLDAEGRLFITGRKKDVIIRGSHNIDPQGIEDALTSHDDVEIAAAVGMPDPYAGELPVAFVTLRAGAQVTEETLLDHLAPRIEERAAMPKRIAVIDAMPLTAVGKIFKPALRNIGIDWAIAAAAKRAGVAEEAYTLTVSDTQEAHITAAPETCAALRTATTGMPISIDFEERP